MAKSEWLGTRVSPEEKALFHAAARTAGLSVSEWLARAATASIRPEVSKGPEHPSIFEPEHPSTHEHRA